VGSAWLIPPGRTLPLRIKPSGDDGLTEVRFWVFARAVERPGADPEDGPAQVVRVSLDHRIEEVDGGGLGPQEFVRPVEILPRLRDGPFGVVVEMLVLVPADDVLRLERCDLVDCVSPRPEAADDHTLREIHVTAVVDHVPRDNQPEVRHVQNAGIGAVGVAASRKRTSAPPRRWSEKVPTAVIGRELFDQRVAAIPAVCGRKVMERRRAASPSSICLRAKSDHLRPLIGFVGDQLPKIGGRARKHRRAKVGERRLDLGIG
jgi:hypothetical protein